jgi:hypothetical protein
VGCPAGAVVAAAVMPQVVAAAVAIMDVNTAALSSDAACHPGREVIVLSSTAADGLAPAGKAHIGKGQPTLVPIQGRGQTEAETGRVGRVCLSGSANPTSSSN